MSENGRSIREDMNSKNTPSRLKNWKHILLNLACACEVDGNRRGSGKYPNARDIPYPSALILAVLPRSDLALQFLDLVAEIAGVLHLFQ